MSNPKSILIIKPGSLGDIVHALPSISYLKNTWPEAKISWIIDSRWKGLFESVEGLDALIEFPRETFHGVGGWARSVAWFASLGAYKPDLAIDLQGLMRSALMARAAGSLRVAGGSDAREGAGFVYGIRATVNPKAHAVDRYRSILMAAGADTSTPPKFPLSKGTPPPGFTTQGFLLLHPYSRGEGKSLTPQQTAALCRALQPLPIVIAGIGPSPENLPRNAIDLLNQTSIQEFLWLARSAEYVVSVDSGPAHIADAVNPNILCIHTWSDPRKVGPYHSTAHIWQGGKIRVQDPSPEAPCHPGRPFDDGDISHVADWLQSRAELASPQ